MRIAYVCADPGVPAFGAKGCSVHLQEIIRSMRAHGAEVTLFASRFDNDRPPDLKSLRVHMLPEVPKGDLAQREQAAIALNPVMRAALEREGLFDLIYERYSLWSFSPMEFARDAGVPGFLEVNAPLIEEQEQHRGLLDRAAAERAAERVFGAATALIAVSREVAGYLERFAEARGRVHVIPNGANPERFRPDLIPSLPARPGMFTVGFVGSLKPWHGLPALVEAFAKLHRRHADTRLLIVGDGKERSRVKADLAAHRLIGAAYLTGAVDPNEVPGMMASMDVAVAPYSGDPHFYFSPLKVYEYMAACLPVVASRCGQLTELIQDGVNGILYPPGDTDMLAEALDRLRQDTALRARLGNAARTTVLRDHTWDAVAQRIMRLAQCEAARCPS